VADRCAGTHFQEPDAAQRQSWREKSLRLPLAENKFRAAAANIQKQPNGSLASAAAVVTPAKTNQPPLRARKDVHRSTPLALDGRTQFFPH